MDGYTFLFPYEKIKPKSNILIYGAGNTGIEYLKQMLITNYCSVIGIVDRNADNIPGMVVPVFKIEDVNNLKFDYVVIAMKNPTYNAKIISDLKSFNVPDSKIVFVGKREEINSIYSGISECKNDLLAIRKTGISMAVQISSGIGDIIITKRFIKQLLNLSTNLNVDIYCSNDMAKSFYDADDKINAIITPQEETFQNMFGKYDIAIFVRFFLTFYSFKEDRIRRYDSRFADVLKRLYISTQNYNNDCAVNERVRVFYERADYANKSVYQFPNYYEDVLGIRDSKVDIPLRKEWKAEFERQNISNYITVNYGNGIGSRNISKQWPLDNFSQLVGKVKKQYPQLKIIQLGAANADKIADCDDYFLGKNLEFVKYVLLNSFLHIDIEGGLVHVATQLGTKCVVLFGPTSLNAFGYPQNINIKAGDCHNCCGVESNIYKCARHLDTPACMEAIEVNMVFKEVANYLDTIL